MTFPGRPTTATTWRRHRAGRRLGDEGHRRAVDQHVGLHSDVHAGLAPDRPGHELVAGGADDFSRQRASCWCRWCSTPTPARSTAFRFPCIAGRRFGIRGANVPALLRALVACGWFGIQTWIGGEAIYHDPRRMIPALGAAAQISGEPAAIHGSTCAVRLLSCRFGCINMCGHLQGDRIDPHAAEHQSAAADRISGCCCLAWAYVRSRRVRDDAFAAVAVRT